MPDALTSADMELARLMVQSAVWMKRRYQDAGPAVARVFCEAKEIDVDALEREIRVENATTN